MSESSMHAWHHPFLSRFVEELFPTWIQYPKTTAEAAPFERVFASLGLPGAMGSTDCTHVPWGRCPAKLSSLFTGKEGYPTVAYEVTVDHHSPKYNG
jgi:hypothetical protein